VKYRLNAAINVHRQFDCKMTSASERMVIPKNRHEGAEQGASLVEYALLVALLAIVCFAAVQTLGGSTSDQLSRFGESLSVAGR
jgi:Flp pilus assembly pilin Flp